MTDTPTTIRANAYETAVDTIADLAEAGHEPILQEENLLVVREHQAMGGSTVRVVDLAAARESTLTRPSRIKRHTGLGDVESFNAYLARYWSADASIVYRTGKATFSAVIDGDPVRDLGGQAAGWGSHKASLHLRYSDRLAAWQGMNGDLLDQVDFVERLEDQMRDVVEPDAADLVEMVQFLSGNVNTSWSSAYSLKDGARRLVWDESMTTAGTVKQSGSRDLPGTLTLQLPLFQHDTEDVDIFARLRIRVKDGTVRLGIVLDNLDALVEMRIGQVLDAIEAAGHGPVLTAETV